MANPMRGEARFEAGGKAYVLRFSFNELVSMEDELGVKAVDIGANLAGSAKMVRTVFRICLQANHGEMTDADAGDIISLIGPEDAARLLGKAFSDAFPQGLPGQSPPEPASTPAKRRSRTRGIGSGA